MTHFRHWLLFLAAMVLLSISAEAQVSFFQPPTYASSEATIFVADFNRDGKPDILGDAGSSWLLQLGNGNGTFSSGTPVPGTPLAVADFNGDGIPDLLEQGTGTLQVLLGNGDGTFQAPLTTVTGVSLYPIVAGDLNAKADVVGVVNNTLMVYLGNGDGTFAPGVSYNLPSGTNVLSIILGDVNGDGKTDITLMSSGSVVVFLGNGDGTLQTPPITSLGSFCGSTVEGDFNQDGNIDLVNSCNSTELLLGNGNGSFQAPVTVISEVGLLAAADLNADGDLDLVIQNTSTPMATIYLGSGNGAFTQGASYYEGVTSDPFFQTPVVADFNLDGKPDIAAEGQLLLGNGDGTFQGTPAVLGVSPSAVAFGDFGHTGTQDIAAISNGSVYIFLNNGSAALTLAYTYPLQQTANGIATADLNGDGNLDLVVTGQDSITQNWSYSVLMGNGNGSFQPPVFYQQSVSGAAGTVLITDFNNDGKPDLAVALPGNSNLSLAVLLGNGDGTFGTPEYFFDAGATSIVTADFNGDGNADIAVGATAGTGLLFGNGDGTFQTAVFPANLMNLVVSSTADFNNDGKPDLLLSATLGAQIGLGNGNGTFTLLPSFAPQGTEFFQPGPPIADFNGDGNLDVPSTEGIGGSSYSYGLFLGNGDGTFGSFLFEVASLGCNFCYSRLTVLGAADMNGDGRPDLIFGEQGTLSSIVVMLNTTPPNFEVSASVLSPATVIAGNSATSTVTIRPTFGFNGTVALSCGGLPGGASCVFNPPSIVNSSGTSSLTIHTSASTAAGTYPVKIQGTSGSVVDSTIASLVVKAAPDFTMEAASGTSTSQTVSAGQSAKFSLVIGPSGSFTGTVNLSCSIKPVVTPAPTCSLSNSSVQISGSGSQPVTVTVGTTAPGTAGTLSHIDFPSLWLPLTWMGMSLSAGWLLVRNRKRAPVLAVPIVVLAIALWVGCGGGSSSSQNAGTPAGTYTATITGTSGALSHNMTLTVIVQ